MGAVDKSGDDAEKSGGAAECSGWLAEPSRGGCDGWCGPSIWGRVWSICWAVPLVRRWLIVAGLTREGGIVPFVGGPGKNLSI